ncbi:MAG TPA: hypothetical protein VMI32_17855 [Candidatus Solibacter sp.]|nr:hypothetical protein [Candidatus Solibacter sp.]
MASAVVIINGGKGAEEEAVEIGEDRGAAGGDPIGGEKAIDVGEGEVDALRGLEILGSGEEIVGEIFGFLLFLQVQVMGAEPGMRIGRELTALTACGGAMGTTSCWAGGIKRLRFHGGCNPDTAGCRCSFFEIGGTPPPVFCAKSAEDLEKMRDRHFGDAKECVRV